LIPEHQRPSQLLTVNTPICFADVYKSYFEEMYQLDVDFHVNNINTGMQIET